MKILLVGINAKYIHSNLAVYSLRAFSMQEFAKDKDLNNGEIHIEILEFTINQPVSEIIQKIYKAHGDMICFSCYIWNIMAVEKIAAELFKVLADVPIWLGGPEVSFDLEWQMKRFPTVTGVIYGEGEKTFFELIKTCGGSKDHTLLAKIPGIVYRDDERRIIINAPGKIMDMNELPFPYDDLKEFENRIIYYETSRGCPFSCAYCLSSVEKKIRYRSLEKVYADLKCFIDAKVKQVKFVDRTFNCDHDHAVSILRFIKAHDNGVTNFHFEIAGDLLTKEEAELIGSLRPGLIQLEIGVQTTNEKTLQAINRKTDLTLLKNNVANLLRGENVHLHLDLIAGLPYENMESFIRSFNEVYEMGGHELQLGFLKMLHGAPMMKMKEEHEIVCSDFPPYEVMRTRELSYEEILRLKAAEEMLELYHNSGQFGLTERFLLSKDGSGRYLFFESPFDFYDRLADYYEEKNYPVICSAREKRYGILLSFAEEKIRKREHTEKIRELLTVDYYLRERAKSRPSFAADENDSLDKKQISMIFEKYAKEQQLDAKQIAGQLHVEILKYVSLAPDKALPQVVVMDYRYRDPVTKEAGRKIYERKEWEFL